MERTWLKPTVMFSPVITFPAKRNEQSMEVSIIKTAIMFLKFSDILPNTGNKKEPRTGTNIANKIRDSPFIPKTPKYCIFCQV
jgi:hypothetical protein